MVQHWGLLVINWKQKLSSWLEQMEYQEFVGKRDQLIASMLFYHHCHFKLEIEDDRPNRARNSICKIKPFNLIAVFLN